MRRVVIAENHASAKDAFTRVATWEGSVSLSGENDREEVKRILDEIITELEGLPDRTLRQERSLEAARELADRRW